MRPADWYVVVVLHEYGQYTQNGISLKVGLDKVTISRSVGKLAKRRLIVRTPHQADGRSHYLALTATGDALYEELKPYAVAWQNTLFADWHEDEIALLTKGLAWIQATASAGLAELGNRSTRGSLARNQGTASAFSLRTRAFDDRNTAA